MWMQRKRKRYSRDEREGYVERFEKSGLSARAFALAEGIGYPSLLRWLKAGRRAERKRSFVELEVPLGGSASGVEIFLRDGTAMRVADTSSAVELLKELGLGC